MTITIKSAAAELDGMRVAGRLASEVLDMLGAHVKPGVSTEQLDKLAHGGVHQGVVALCGAFRYADGPAALLAHAKERDADAQKARALFAPSGLFAQAAFAAHQAGIDERLLFGGQAAEDALEVATLAQLGGLLQA